MKIKRFVESVPGGLMMIPLLCGMAINTFAPNAGAAFGSFTNGLFTGSLSILAVFFVCTGATISLKSLPAIAKRGGVLMLTKIGLGALAGFSLGRSLGLLPVATGWFTGLSTLAVVTAINDTNGGLYMALMRQYGSVEETAAYSVMALESGPFLTMVTLGVVGLSSFPYKTLIGAILPLCVGMLLGNLDPELREFLGQGAPVLIPFFAFALGSTMDLHRVWEAGALGLVLGLAVLVISAVALIIVDRLIGGEGTAGMAAATTAGNAVAVPSLVAIANPSYAPAAQSATVLVAASVIVTSVLAPPLTAWWHSRAIRRRKIVRRDRT